jgi:hypothetical protein
MDHSCPWGGGGLLLLTQRDATGFSASKVCLGFTSCMLLVLLLGFADGGEGMVRRGGCWTLTQRQATSALEADAFSVTRWWPPWVGCGEGTSRIAPFFVSGTIQTHIHSRSLPLW